MEQDIHKAIDVFIRYIVSFRLRHMHHTHAEGSLFHCAASSGGGGASSAASAAGQAASAAASAAAQGDYGIAVASSATAGAGLHVCKS